MRKIYRLDENDLREMVMERFDVRPEQVMSVHTEEPTGYFDDGEHVEPVFYIEVEIKDGR